MSATNATNGIFIVSTGRYTPEDIVPNQRFTEIVETSDEWITSRTGIQERRFCNGEPTWYMGAQAAEKALQSGQVEAEDIDLIVAATVSPDYYTPSLSCLVQREIGASKAQCLDINCACSGFVSGLDLARRYLAFDDVQTVLLVASERLSQITDFTDRSSCVLLGDGAGACVVRKREGGLYSCLLGADGTQGGVLHAKHPRKDDPFSKKNPLREYTEFEEGRDGYLYMNGREVYKFATRVLPLAIKTCCEKLGLKPNDLDHLIPHQANYRIVDTALKSLEISDKSKVYLNLSHYGNTGCASIAIALDEMNEKGLLKRGDKIGAVGFGGGLTYAGAVFEW